MVSLFLVSVNTTVLMAQESRLRPVLAEIENDFRSGDLSLDQRILYRVYAGFEPGRLPAVYKSAPETYAPVKCGFPILMEYRKNQSRLSRSTIDQVEAVLQSPYRGAYSYVTPGGNFIVYYDTTGTHAVPGGDGDTEFGGNGIPDYVDWVAAAVDSSWRHEVVNLGFVDPVEQPSDPYPVYIENAGSVYGYTDYSSPRGSTIMAINSRLDEAGFTNNDDKNPTRGAIRVTLAHELKHAIQYANSEWYGWAYNQDGYAFDQSSPHATNWSETDATLMEEVVYDDVNDYYNYITDASGYDPVFTTEMHAVPAPYAGVTWAIYFWEMFGDTFWPAVWGYIGERFQAEKNNPEPDFLTMPEAIGRALELDYESRFAHAFAESHLWHYASGQNKARVGYGFDEKFSYPSPLVNVSLTARDSTLDFQQVAPLSAHYITSLKTTGLEGYVRVKTFFDLPMRFSVGVIGYFSDGSVETVIRSGNQADTVTVNTTWDWREIEEVGVVVANFSSDGIAGYKVTVTSHVPEELQLAQNYPNPFNPGTTITFALPQRSRVVLTVFDVTGRKIATLRDEVLQAGFYEVPFHAGSLASGIYFYRLSTERSVLTRKMTFIK